MKKLAFGILVVLAGLVFVIASELVVVEWLKAAPFDITGNFFLTGVFPVHLIMQVVIVSAIAPLLRQQPGVFIGIYLVVSLAAYVAMLANFANPTADIVRYVISAAVTAALALWLNRSRIFQRT